MARPELELTALGGAPRTRPRTDLGTFLLHWALVIAMVFALVTGFRLTWDGEGATYARLFDKVLMNGDVWTPHFYAALGLFALALAYPLYLRRAALHPRNALLRLRVLRLQAPARLKWQAGNVALHWLFYGLAIGMMATGLLLYFGFGGIIVTLHMALAVAMLVYTGVHIFGHFMQGGLAQWLRIFLPQRLMSGPNVRPLALPVALIGGGILAAGLFGVDGAGRPTLDMALAAQPPRLENLLDDPAWRAAPMVRVHTHQGANLAGGRGESDVELRALRSGEMVYFAFRWQDPSRSIKRLPLLKTPEGWRLLNNHADTADETAFYEDKFAVLFGTKPDLGGGVTGMGRAPLPGLPGAINGRGLHYTEDSSILDMWQWKASRGGMLGHVDDMHIGPPYPANAGQKAGTERYSAGYLQDPGSAFYRYNYAGQPPGGYRGPLAPLRLPKDYAALKAKMGTIDLTPGASDDEGSQWWMFDQDSTPYSAELDAKIPVGAVIPSTLIGGTYAGDRADLTGLSRWKDGWWTLIVSRRIATGSKYDIDFLPGRTLYIWVSVFDHTQTRHTRHLRPIRLRVPG